jgi:competence protein ComEC
VIVPYLRGEGIRGLDGLVLSHDDSDHHGGALSLLEAAPAQWLLTSMPAEHPLVAAGPRAIACQAGQGWTWDGVRFEVLAPTAESYANPKIGDNSRSCVLRVSSAAGSVLLAGDIERKAEAELTARVGDGLRSSLVVAPHHGSAGGSSPAFVAAAAPDAVVFTAGYRNPFGHPRADVVQRYRDAGAAVYRSDTDGAVSFFFDASGRPPERWREARRRYWQEAVAGGSVPPEAADY